MEPFDSIIKDLEDFNQTVYDVLARSVEDNDEAIIKKNVDRISKLGKKPDGSRIKRSDKSYRVYSAPYTIRKSNLGLYQGFVDLSLEGGYLRSYRLRIEGSLVYIEGEKDVAGFDLAEFIRDKYGEVEGLNNKDWEEIAEEFIIPNIYEKILSIW